MTVANYRTKRTYHLIAFIKQKAHTHAHTCGHRHQQSGIIMHVEYAGSPGLSIQKNNFELQAEFRSAHSVIVRHVRNVGLVMNLKSSAFAKGVRND